METVSLLETKLYYPSKRSNFIHRHRLIDKLAEGAERKFTLVCAPAGYGKTTLLSDWIRNSDGPAAWLSLDEEDNELDCFLTYFIAALQKLDSTIALEIQAELVSSEKPPAKSLLTKLIGELSAADQDFILVLDDYHRITAKPVHELLEFLLDHLPTNLHLVISGRAEPPLPLARFRVREQMTEIRTADLKFTEDEASAFLNTAMGLDLSSNEIAALESRTEGWIASLQMAALSLHGRNDTKDFVDAFSGSHRHVLDYLIDEVLSLQTQEMKTFLFRTSILDRLCGPLCDHLLEIKSGQQILDQLDKDNLFLIPLDDERRWFRYHHLFADLLSSRLHQEESGLTEELHHRAASWFMANDFAPEAISHALTAEDFDRAAQIIESISGALVEQGRLAPVLSWTEKLPDQVISKHPRTALSRAWACFLTGKTDEVESLLKMIDKHLSKADEVVSPGYAEIMGSIKTIRVLIASGTGDLHRDIEIALEAYQDLPAVSVLNKNALATNLGFSYLASGELDSATSFFEGIRDQVGNAEGAAVTTTTKAVAKVCLGDVQAVRGQFGQAERIYKSALEAGTKWSADQLFPATGRAHVGLAKVLYERNDLDAAFSHLTRGIALGEQNTVAAIVLKGNLVMVKLQQAQGEIDAAYDALERAREVASQAHRAPEARQITSWEAGLWLAQGNLDAAGKWAGGRIGSIKDKPDYLKRIEHIMVARILIARGKADKALELLAGLIESAKAGGHLRDAVELLTLKAMAEQANHSDEESLSTIREALNMAEPEGYVRTLIDNGQAMAVLLKEAVSRGICRGYATKLLKQFRGESARKTSRHAGRLAVNQPLVAPLSDRELEVMALVAEGLKYREIADNLFVSLNTIRAHSKSIYSKLSVDSRAQAIDKARELKLI